METSRGFVPAVFFAFAIALLAACSGGGTTLVPRSFATAVPTSAPAAKSASTAIVSFSLTIPKTSTAARRRRPDYVSMGTNSASIVVVGPSPSASAEPAVTMNCTSGQTCGASLVAPIGTDTFSVTLYSGQNETGATLGIGSADKTIVMNQANAVAVTLDGVVNSVRLTTNPAILPAGMAAKETVTIDALDAAGDTIVAPGGYVDASGNPLSISVARIDYGNGKGVTTPGTTAANGTMQTYAYNGSDIDETAYTSSTSPAILGNQGTAKVDYTPTYIQKYADSTGADTNFVTMGPDRNLWFTDFGTGTIGSIVPSTGAIAHYTIPTTATNGSAEPEAIVAGPNDTMYFAEYNSNAIGSISTTVAATAGALTPVTEIPLTTLNANPRGIVYNAVCDPNIWFTEFNGNKIGTLSTTTMTVTEYTVPTTGAEPDQIACGDDGNFWFTEYGGNKIGQITPAGVIKEFPLPNPAAAHGPIGIALGAEGSMWVAEALGNSIAKIATSRTTPAATVGTVTEYPLPPTVGSPGGTSMYPSIITSAPDGDLFFSEFNSETQTVNATIGRITTTAAAAPDRAANVPTSYALDDNANMPYGICVGPDGHIWYVEMGSGQIGYLVY